MAITLTEQISCVQRELSLRRACYPKFILKKTITSEKAEYEIEAMRTVLHTLLEVERGVRDV
jgi:hypothetical protein